MFELFFLLYLNFFFRGLSNDLYIAIFNPPLNDVDFLCNKKIIKEFLVCGQQRKYGYHFLFVYRYFFNWFLLKVVAQMLFNLENFFNLFLF
jgi:hypothetical protein